MVTCISIHTDTGTLCFRPIILLRVCCSDNCLFGQRERNAAGISISKVKQANRGEYNDASAQTSACQCDHDIVE